jgi:integrase
MTVEKAHELYMEAVREGRGSSAKRPNKPRTIAEKLEIYRRDLHPGLGWKSIYEVTEDDLVRLVNDKGRTAKVRANRLAAELRVFFGWAASLRGTAVGLADDPSVRLRDLRFAETPRTRQLSLEEIGWFLAGVAKEADPVFRRGMLIWLLSAARMGEVVRARTDEVEDGIWTIPGERVKNGSAHRIALGPWARSLMRWPGEWLFPAIRVVGPRTQGWYGAKSRVHQHMERLAGRSVERFTPHDFRRTARSNTKRLNFDYETGEAILNHLKRGLERTYDRYDLEREKRAFFLAWEAEIAAIGRSAGVAGPLGIPKASVYHALGVTCSDEASVAASRPGRPGTLQLQPRHACDPLAPNVIPIGLARERRREG